MLQLKTDETRLVLTNRHKVFWPGEGFTKGDLLDYYREIAAVIVPHLRAVHLDWQNHARKTSRQTDQGRGCL
jgi:DNA primase